MVAILGKMMYILKTDQAVSFDSSQLSFNRGETPERRYYLCGL
jgi:hypothetical protein